MFHSMLQWNMRASPVRNINSRFKVKCKQHSFTDNERTTGGRIEIQSAAAGRFYDLDGIIALACGVINMNVGG